MSAAEPLPIPDTTRRTSSSDQVALYIRRLIFDGHLRPGTRVPQDDVANTLGVSRIPVREALIALEREGWVTIELHRGAFVNALDARAVADHYELYGMLYGFAVQRALDRGTPQVIERLSSIAREFAATRDLDSANRLAIAFHSEVVDAAASPRLSVVVRAMSTLVPTNIFRLIPEAVEIERKRLTAIVRAMNKGDADAAADEYAKLLEQIGSKVVRLFDARGLFVAPSPPR